MFVVWQEARELVVECYSRLSKFKFRMLKKKEKNKWVKNVPGHSGQLRPKQKSPSILEGVPAGGVVI